MPGQQERQGGFQRVISDIVDLCELQWQLLTVDGQEAKRRAVKAAILIAFGGVVALSGITAAVIGCGWLMHEQFELSPGVSFLLTSGIAMTLAVVCLLLGAKLLGRANASLSEAKREFSENVKWVKSVVLSPNTSPRNQLRREDFAPEPPPVATNGRF